MRLSSGATFFGIIGAGAMSGDMALGLVMMHGSGRRTGSDGLIWARIAHADLMPETTKLAWLWWVGSHAASRCAGLLGRKPADTNHVALLATGTDRLFVA